MLDRLFPALEPNERSLFAGSDQEAPWGVLGVLQSRVERWMEALGARSALWVGEGATVEGVVACSALYVGAGAQIEPTAVLTGGPVVIAPGACVRAGAYVRGPAFIGERAVVGHATELKNSVLLAGAAAPHFAYVGDSILGHRCNLGAGTRLANLRLDGRTVRVEWEGGRIDTGLQKLGALIGDGAQTGCNAVLNPGTILLPGALVRPCTAVTGTVQLHAPRPAASEVRAAAPRRAARG